MPTTVSTRLAGILLFAVVAMWAALPAPAEDVVVATNTGGTRTRHTGTITEYTGRQLTLRSATGRETNIPAERIVDMQTTKAAAHEDADHRFAERDFEAAFAQYREAARLEQRVWMRRRIIAQAIRCLHNLGRIEAAGEMFLRSLYPSDPDTPDFDALPLSWRTTEPSAALTAQAKQWLANEPLPPAVLLGASWLLSTSERPRCLATLERLARQPDGRVAGLATTQLWRTLVVTVPADDLVSWQDHVTSLPPHLRAGPYFVLAQALSRHKQSEAAALAYLRVPLQFSQQYDLASQGLLHAGRELEKAARPEEARRLYGELTRDYATSPAAALARERLSPPK